MAHRKASKAAVQVDEVRVDLLDVYSTLDLLRGLPKNAAAPLEFLTAKASYNGTYDQVQRGKISSLQVPPLSLPIESVCDDPGQKNFWRGTAARSRLSYTGYVGGKTLDQVAWSRFVPFRVGLPLTATALQVQTGWAIEESSAYLWSCGWAISLQSKITANFPLADLLARTSLLKTQAVPMTLGGQLTSQTVWGVLSAASQWVQERLIQPVLQPPLPAPRRYGPFLFVTVVRGPKRPELSALDEPSQRAIYAVTSQDPAWESYSITKIKENFKETDHYPGSFIFMDRMGRFFWFPTISATALGCYVENTKAAMMTMTQMGQFIRLLTERQTGSDLKGSYPLRDLFGHAVTALEGFQALYPNTNVKRLSRDLDLATRIRDARARLS